MIFMGQCYQELHAIVGIFSRYSAAVPLGDEFRNVEAEAQVLVVALANGDHRIEQL
jgi:hypothetical protein